MHRAQTFLMAQTFPKQETKTERERRRNDLLTYGSAFADALAGRHDIALDDDKGIRNSDNEQTKK